VLALVLELVEGETLDDRIAAGPVPLAEALTLAQQIVLAIEWAHEQGVIHRDLKPANITVRADGTVKVLDFGLAKAFAQDAEAIEAAATMSATGIGVITGTLAYMSPEQAIGQPADRRTDIWAFGCTLFELLTGRKAFGGATPLDTIAAVQRASPDWSLLPASTPPAVERLLRRALEKERRDRLPDIAAARLELKEALEPSAPRRGPVVVDHRSPPVAWLVAAGAIVIAGFAGFDAWRQRQTGIPAAPGAVTRTAIALPPQAELALGTRIPELGFDSPALALSADGRRLAYVGQSGTSTQLYLRDLDALDVRPVTGTEGAIHAFFAPDGRRLGFLTNDRVKIVPLDGGPPVTLASASQPISASWVGTDIYFSENQGAQLSRVSEAGGAPTVVIADYPNGKFTQVLPGATHALATLQSGSISADYADVMLVPLGFPARHKVLARTAYGAQYVDSGHVIFGRAGGLFAVRVDVERETPVGEPVQIVTDASMESLFGQVHAASSRGVLAYVPGGERARGRLAWVGRRGGVEYIPADTRVYGTVDLSPDGTRIAAHVADVVDHLWTYDLAQGVGRRLALDEHSGWPVWAPDSRTLAFARWTSAERRSVSARTGDAAPVALLPASGRRSVIPYAWSPDAGTVAATGVDGGFFDVKTQQQVAAAVGNMPQFSPDGAWVTYSASVAGRLEVFIRSYPKGDVIRQVSPDGGVEPVWCACGELFYQKENRWLATRVNTATLSWPMPAQVAQTDFIDSIGRSYDVSSDGRKILVVKAARADLRSRIHIVTNWDR
jgi:serine/threonine-protein kinase